MPRGLSAAVKSYSGPIRWAVKITLLDSTLKYYAQEALTFLGQAYEPYLESVGPVRLTRTLEADSTEITLRNVDLTIGDLLRQKAFDGAQCTVKLLLLAINKEVEVLPRAVLREEEQDQRLARFQVSSRLDPSLLSVTSRKFTTDDFPIVSPETVRIVRETPGSGDHPRYGCVLEGTGIVPLGHPMRIISKENHDWIEIELLDGRRLTATPDHPIYTDRGKIPLAEVGLGESVVTDHGMVPVKTKRKLHFSGRKLVITMAGGYLFLANGILSHNKREVEPEVDF